MSRTGSPSFFGFLLNGIAMKFDAESWMLERGRLGGLDCIVISPRAGTPNSLVVLCHGFGAPGSDLVNLAEELVPILAGESPEEASAPAFLFPEGLLDMSEDFGVEGPRAWWRINMARLAELTAASSFDEMRNEVPDGISEASAALQSCITHCLSEKKWENATIVLGGFSQGAMLAVQTAGAYDASKLRGLILWSGALICESDWHAALDGRHRGLDVFQSHGTQDMILPISTGRALRGFLESESMSVDYIEFAGPHTISYESIEGAARLIDRVLQNASE
jgi:phospholipase/carboxylesterase